MEQATKELLVAVRAGVGARIQPPLGVEEIELFREDVRKLFNDYELPATYLEILAEANGINKNGFTLYANQFQYEAGQFVMHGFLEDNQLLRGPDGDCAGLGDLYFFAESGQDLYQQNRDTGAFELSDRTSGGVYETFESADDMFQDLFKNMLNLFVDAGAEIDEEGF